MRDFWDNSPFLAGIALGAFLFYGLGHLASKKMDHSQVRYEQCIAAGKQWIEGSCVK